MTTFALIMWITTNAPAADKPLMFFTLRTGMDEETCLEHAAQYVVLPLVYDDGQVRVFTGLMCKTENTP